MGQYRYAHWRLLFVVVVCNAAGGQAGGPAAGRAVNRPPPGQARVCLAAVTARRASTVTSR